MFNSGADRSWKTILDAKRADFVQQNCELPPILLDEGSLCDQFEALCKENNEFYYTRLFPQLKYHHIDAFASEVDEVMVHSVSDSVSTVVSGGTFVAVKCLCDAGIPLQSVVELIGLLNSKIPHLGVDLHRFPYDMALQKPLQEIFIAYMDALLCIIQYATLQPRPTDFNPIEKAEDFIRESAKKFQTGETQFQRLLAQALQTEAAHSSYKTRSWSGSSTSGKYLSHETNTTFKPIRKVGWGSSAEVTIVEEISTRELYARKQFFLNVKRHTNAMRVEDVKHEYNVMKRLWHAQHVAKVLLWSKDDEATCSIYMQPVADCDLRYFLEQCVEEDYPEATLKQITPWFGCLLDTLSYAHGLKIVHQDIKPNNILVKDQQVYLADFGLAKDFSFRSTSKTSSNLVCGTPVYRAPEVRPGTPRGPLADVFALGCVFSEMLTVRSRRSLDDYQEYREAIDNEGGMYAFRANLPKVNEWLKQFNQNGDSDSETLVWQIGLMLKEDASRRSGAQDGRDFLKSQKHSPTFFCSLH